MRMLEHVQQVTLTPLIQATSAPGTRVYTDADDLDTRLGPWGDEHERVCHGRGA
jgi:transposase